jgi:cell wall-associated NlpC family hydrolase
MCVKRIIFLIVVIVPVFLLSGCIRIPETIKDIRDLKQDHLSYIDSSAADRALATVEIQNKLDTNFNSLYFSPWHQTASGYSLDKLKAMFEKFEKMPGYAENGRRYKKTWFKKLRVNSQLETYPHAGYPAVTTDNVDLRAFPTHKPFFRKFNHVQSGYPFDRFQESLVAANTPIFISHTTKDKAWVFVETAYLVGWIPSRITARVDADFIKTWENGKYAMIIRDKTSVCDDGGRFLFHASLGSLFPEIEGSKSGTKILVAVADMNRKAVAKIATVSKETVVLKPLRLTPLNLAKTANELINEPYGWGGMYQNRDCSSMIRDMFAPFGIWLPRNSTDQAMKGGEFIDLQNLSAQEKESMIVKRGIPYLTLIWKRGHIMLYIGEQQGRALVFHNFWSIRTRDWKGRHGRMIVGHAAITTLHPGQEYQSAESDYDYINNVLGMTLLINPSAKGEKYPKDTPLQERSGEPYDGQQEPL